MKFSRFTSHKDSTVEGCEGWEELKTLLSKLHGSTKEVGAWSPASYPDGSKRAKANVEEVHALVLDLDKITEKQVLEMEADLAPYSYLAHESFSSTKEKRCCRFVIQLTRPVKPSEWSKFWRQAMEELNAPADPSTSDASRIYFLPARPKHHHNLVQDYELEVHEGDRLDVDAILAVSSVEVETPRMESLEHGLIPAGARDTTLHRYAGALRRQGLEVTEIRAALSAINQNRCEHPLPEEDISRLAASAQKYAMVDDQQEMVEFMEAIEARRLKPAKNSDGYIVDLADFYAEYDENSDDNDNWLIQGVLGKGVPQLMAGPPKSHKSWNMYSMALSLAAGRRWLEEFDTKRCRTLVMSHEDNAKEAHRRIFRLAKGSKIDPADIRGWLSVNAVDKFYFNDARYVDELRRGIEAWEPDCIFMDSLSRSHTADENSAQDMSIVTQTWDDLCKEYGIAVVVVHHFNKGEGGGLLNRMRGTSDLGAMVRHAIGVRKLDIEDSTFEGGVSTLDFEGNLPGMSDSFSVGLRDGTSGDDKTVHLEYRSKAKDEVQGQIKKQFLDFLLASEPEPQTKQAILNSTKAGTSMSRISALGELIDGGKVTMLGKKYIVSDIS